MMYNKLFFLIVLFFAGTVSAQVTLTHQAWYENTFGDLRNVVQANRDLNLLTFPNARLEKANAVNNNTSVAAVNSDFAVG